MSIAGALEDIRGKTEAACARSGRKPEEVRLMGVSKFHGPALVGEAWDAGLRLFGESRVQEVAEKFEGFRDTHRGLELHMIGSLQRNKVKAALGLFDSVDSVDRDELITELGKLAAGREKPLSVLLELNSGEDSKSGYPREDDLFAAAELVFGYPGLMLRGLMTMAPQTTDTSLIRRAFRSLVSCRNRLQARFPEGDFSCLSMGMSGDFEIAIEEGSTLVRIGTAIFGRRE